MLSQIFALDMNRELCNIIGKILYFGRRNIEHALNETQSFLGCYLTINKHVHESLINVIHFLRVRRSISYRDKSVKQVKLSFIFDNVNLLFADYACYCKFEIFILNLFAEQ